MLLHNASLLSRIATLTQNMILLLIIDVTNRCNVTMQRIITVTNRGTDAGTDTGTMHFIIDVINRGNVTKQCIIAVTNSDTETQYDIAHHY